MAVCAFVVYLLSFPHGGIQFKTRPPVKTAYTLGAVFFQRIAVNSYAKEEPTHSKKYRY